MALFKILKCLKNNLPSAKKDGYCYFTTDDQMFYIDILITIMFCRENL